MSSRNAKMNSPSTKWRCTASNAGCCPIANKRGIMASPCSPPSPAQSCAWCPHLPPTSTLTAFHETWTRMALRCAPHHEDPASWHDVRLSRMRCPWVEFCDLLQRMCDTLTSRSGGKSALNKSGGILYGFHHLLRLLATNLLTTSLATMPLTPPSGFWRAVNLPNLTVSRTLGGTCAPL